ncbi:MAG: DUF2652 domain-containing protein [Bacteroidetes bacterium]|nr:DUF2652 domain-containing protein [Bacteroidota bacterium]MCW5895422.1 DUF2652 domain-containing protein [Bacteroidota bacterium]
MDSTIQRGYFVLADISGYTPFMAESELDHAYVILNDILTLLIKHLTPALRLVEVEGDAVFVYAPEASVTRGETILEMIEATYVAFRDRKGMMQHNSVCPCVACRSIAALDLKFVAHYGEYAMQRLPGSKAKPVGSSINLAHRLLKNPVRESTGWQSYALFTHAALDAMKIWPKNLHEEPLSYEHFDRITSYSVDLHRRYRELTEGRRVLLEPPEAHVSITRTYPFPSAILWDWLSDPAKRKVWHLGSDWRISGRPAGRTDVGARNHCAASGFLEEVLDWRPFEYYTVRYRKGIVNILISARLEEVETNTRLEWNMKIDSKLPRWLMKPTSTFVVSRLMQVKEGLEKLEHLASESFSLA